MNLKTNSVTKAQRIFQDTRFDCLQHLKTWGYEVNKNGSAVGFNRLTYKDNESISIRTINAVSQILERAKRTLTIDIKLGILNEEKATQERNVLNMVESCLNNNRKSIIDFNTMLKNV